MQAAVGSATVQDVTGWASPEVPRAVALPFHAVPVPTTVCRLAGRLVDTHDSRDAPRATPHAVKGAGDRRQVPSGMQALCCSQLYVKPVNITHNFSS